MSRRTELRFRKAADKLLPEGTRAVVAVSGGGDSTALLHLLARMARGRDLELIVAHLDHALRRGSVGDRRFVERTARALKLPCESDRRAVETLRRKDESPEEAARRVRRSFLLEIRKQHAANHIVTGHTLDDQAETVLFRWIRGAGPSALTGMRNDGPGPFVKPLLALSRKDLRTFLTHHELPWREDASNRNLRFDRNRLRRRVLPLLHEEFHPKAAERIVSAADHAREDAAWLDEHAERCFREIVCRRRNSLCLPIAALSLLKPPVLRRVWRLALAGVAIDARRIQHRHLHALSHLLTAEGGAAIDLPGEHRAERRRGNILIF